MSIMEQRPNTEPCDAQVDTQMEEYISISSLQKRFQKGEFVSKSFRKAHLQKLKQT